MIWPFNRKEKQARKKQREESAKLALQSTLALNKAAKSTMSLAEDVTVTLQAKIEDYTAQIDHTARLLADGLMIVNANGKVESFNDAAADMFGWNKREAKGVCFTTFFQLEHGEINEAFMDNFLDNVNFEDAFYPVNYESFRGKKKDGSEIFVDVSASKLVRSDKKVYYIVLVRDVTQKVHHQNTIKKLAEHNQELLQTIDASATGFIILEADNADYKFKFVNQGFAGLIGKSFNDLKEMSLKDLLGMAAGFWSVYRTLNAQLAGRHEIQLDLSDNEMVWFDVHITPVSKNGKIMQWILVFYDTTELKKAYTNLRRSEEHFRAFSESSSESMFIHDASTLLEWNDRLLTLTGYSESELEKLDPLDFVHPLEREFFRAQLLSESATSYETLFTTKHGAVLEVALNSRPIEWKNQEAKIVVARDVTAFKDIELQLRTSRERYRSVIDNTIDMVICFNSDFEITFSNQTFRDYYEVELDDINGFSLLDVIPEADHKNFKEYMLSITQETDVRRGIHRIQRHEEIKWQDWIDRGIFDDQGRLIEIQSVARDITHLMKK